VASVAFFASLIGDGKIYYILYNASGITAFFAWLGIGICHYRFRKAYVAQGRDLGKLRFKAKFYPFGPITSIILCLIVIFGANIWVFQAATFSWFDFITNYICIPLFILLYLVYKHIKKTKVVPLDKCDFEFNEGK
ncbi:MAG: gamma-aminobutyrate permease, partial [Solirubrobacterales bacterium]